MRDVINEPASLIPKIVSAAESRSDKSTDLNLIYCRFAKTTPENLESVSKDLLNIIENLDAKNIIKDYNLFMVLKNKRLISAREVYQKYWDKVAEDLSSIDIHALDIDNVLATLAHRYCIIQKSMLNKYRCKKFESLLRELSLIEIKYGTSAWKPNRISKLATFLIGCAYDPSSEYITLPEYFVRKVEKMASQFTVNEIVDISIGIECFHRNGLPKHMNRRVAMQIANRIG